MDDITIVNEVSLMEVWEAGQNEFFSFKGERRTSKKESKRSSAKQDFLLCPFVIPACS